MRWGGDAFSTTCQQQRTANDVVSFVFFKFFKVHFNRRVSAKISDVFLNLNLSSIRPYLCLFHLNIHWAHKTRDEWDQSHDRASEMVRGPCFELHMPATTSGKWTSFSLVSFLYFFFHVSFKFTLNIELAATCQKCSQNMKQETIWFPFFLYF